MVVCHVPGLDLSGDLPEVEGPRPGGLVQEAGHVFWQVVCAPDAEPADDVEVRHARVQKPSMAGAQGHRTIPDRARRAREFCWTKPSSHGATLSSSADRVALAAAASSCSRNSRGGS